MEKDSSHKIITVSFVLAGFIAAIVVEVLFNAMAGTLGAAAALRSQEALRHGLPIGVGLLTFALLQFNSGVRAWADEVVLEVSKVVWPARKDTMGMTVVVCIMLIVAGVVLGLLDLVSGRVINTIIF